MDMDQFEELMNDSNPSFKIGTYEFYAGSILREMDPTAFRIAYTDFVDALEETV
jgi:hypothetical protein